MANDFADSYNGGCVAKRGRRICKREAAPGTSGLLCQEHLDALQAGDEVKFKSRLLVWQKQVIEALKKAVAKEKPASGETSGATGEGALKRVLLSFPSIFALMGTTAAFFFERVWSNGLGIDLPYGVGLSSGASPLLPQILVSLILVAITVTVLLLVAMTVASAILFIVALARALFRVRYAVEIFLRGLTRILSPHNYALLRPKDDPKGEEIYRVNVEAAGIARTNLAGWKSDFADYRDKSWGNLQTAIRICWQALFSSKDLSHGAAFVRAGALLAAVIVLYFGTRIQAEGLSASLSNIAEQGQRPNECQEVTALPFRVGFEDVGILEFLRSKLPCGRVVLANQKALGASPLFDTALPDGVLLSRVAYHLGRYGDWTILAPLNQPDERVFVQARQVLEFSEVVPDDRPGLVSSEDSDAETLGLAKLKETLSADMSALQEKQAQLAAWQNQFDTEFEERENAQYERLLTGMMQDKPWQAALDDAARRQIELTEKAIASVDALLQSQTEAQAAQLLDLQAQITELASREKSGDQGAAGEWSSAKLTRALDGLMAATEKYLGASEPSLPQSFAGSAPLPSGMQLLRGKFGSDRIDACFRAPITPAPIQFAEGSARVTSQRLAEVEDALRRAGWSPDDVSHTFLVTISGYASSSGSTTRNLQLAEKRADAVKRALSERLFGLDADGPIDAVAPGLFTAAGLVVVAHGSGEALDGVGADEPRRANISICRMNDAFDAPIVEAAADNG